MSSYMNPGRGWTEPKRPDEAMPDVKQWAGDKFSEDHDLIVLEKSPLLQQKIRDWITLNFLECNVTQWVEALIEKNLPDEGWHYRDGYDPRVLLKKDEA